MPRRIDPNLSAALDRLAATERAFVGSEFLAPVLRGHGVGVAIAGVRCTLAVEPADFEGWGVFEATSFTRATLARAMTLTQRRQYLALFPAVRLILCGRDGEHWTALPASRADSRFSIDGLVPVRFVEDGVQFETVLARFDGRQFWFDAPEDRADPATAAYLRQSVGQRAKPESLHRPGLTPEQRAAYALEYADRARAELEARRHTTEGRLRDALAHAGADLREYAERDDVFRVSYTVDGRRHTSVVRRDDLAVVTAGVCLAGGDRHFDLASLVGVLREGEQAGSIVRTHWET